MRRIDGWRARLLRSLMIVLVSLSVSARSASCETPETPPEGLTRAEAVEVFNLVDRQAYRIELLEMQVASMDSFHAIETDYLRGIIEDQKLSAKRTTLLTLAIVAVAGVSVWVGANAAR